MYEEFVSFSRSVMLHCDRGVSGMSWGFVCLRRRKPGNVIQFPGNVSPHERIAGCIFRLCIHCFRFSSTASSAILEKTLSPSDESDYESKKKSMPKSQRNGTKLLLS